MKFFAGFITAIVLVALSLTGFYAYIELKPVEEKQEQQNEKLEDSSTSQQGDQSTQEQSQQTAPATIPSHEQQDNQSIKDQEQKKVEHMKKRASEGASADELHSLEVELEQFRIDNADVLYNEG